MSYKRNYTRYKNKKRREIRFNLEFNKMIHLTLDTIFPDYFNYLNSTDIKFENIR